VLAYRSYESDGLAFQLRGVGNQRRKENENRRRNRTKAVALQLQQLPQKDRKRRALLPVALPVWLHGLAHGEPVAKAATQPTAKKTTAKKATKKKTTKKIGQKRKKGEK